MTIITGEWIVKLRFDQSNTNRQITEWKRKSRRWWADWHDCVWAACVYTLFRTRHTFHSHEKPIRIYTVWNDLTSSNWFSYGSFCSIPSSTMTERATKNREREEKTTHQNRPSTATNVTKKGLRHTQRVDRAMSLVICVKTKRQLRAMKWTHRVTN